MKMISSKRRIVVTIAFENTRCWTILNPLLFTDFIECKCDYMMVESNGFVDLLLLVSRNDRSQSGIRKY